MEATILKSSPYKKQVEAKAAKPAKRKAAKRDASSEINVDAACSKSKQKPRISTSRKAKLQSVESDNTRCLVCGERKLDSVSHV